MVDRPSLGNAAATKDQQPFAVHACLGFDQVYPPLPPSRTIVITHSQLILATFGNHYLFCCSFAITVDTSCHAIPLRLRSDPDYPHSSHSRHGHSPTMVFYTSIFRRDLIIVFAVICLFTIIFSLRSVAPEPQPLPLGNEYKPPQHGTPGTNKPDLDETRPPSQKDPKPSAKAPIAQSKPDPTSTISKPTPSAAPPQTCDGFPNTEDVLVVMKTGATEAYDKLPIHFITTLECVNDYIIFSDMPMDMAGHKLHDALDEIPEEVKKDNADFDLYKKLQEYHRLGEDPRLLRTGSVGWNLDKYKFLPMLAKTWKYRQDAKWYLFIEADTAVIWDNLRLFLDKFDAKKPHYFGSPTYLDIEFAHGGTGYIISQAAMKSAVGGHLDIETKFGMDVAPICCGDRMIAAVLKEEDIKLTKAWPMLNGEKPLTVPYNNKHWCTPVLTMHHLTAQEVSQVWNFEKERKAKGIKVCTLASGDSRAPSLTMF